MVKFKFFFSTPDNSSPISQLWGLFQRNHFALLASWLFLFFVVIALIGPLIAPYSPYEQHADQLLAPPSWAYEGHITNPLGTDALGRDIFSRILVGVSYSFGLAMLAVAISLFIGLIIGTLAGFSKGVKSSILNHFLDVALTMPSLLIAIVIVAILGPGLTNTLWAVVLAILPQFIHHVRTQISELLEQDYVIAYKLDGATKFQQFRFALLPNMVEDLVIFFTMALSSSILDIAVLGFIGIGAQSPDPELGTMIADSLDVFYLNPWTVMLPGIVLFLIILSTNVVGDGLRHALKERRVQ